ncbi:DUF4365 domain-containing protein [Halomonas sp. G15]|uniref:DUF4365 domain-containing protein n=1 Tax=Halomonas sp. G15 TaxID=2903521 RepID=UPI001E62F462|nr:DUF4365 domain-containing protein [Halomonas sp. G15]MCE0733648.1 DUF4365 domain-containing protein [Halomonas sp. G15]
MAKFRALASSFGEFVNYERDRGARDIGIHLTQKLRSGSERMSSSLLWFQMKGIMATTFPASTAESADSFPVSLSVKHLRFWYLQPMPTYLALYVESLDRFFFCNIQAYVETQWGRGILYLDQQTAVVKVPSTSLLDEQAFRLLLQTNDVKEWEKALGTDQKYVGVCYRDYGLIWHLGTAGDRGVQHELEFWDWQSKTRSQVFIREIDDEHSVVLREHWQYMMSISELESAYPYLEFSQNDDDQSDWCDDDEWQPTAELSDGTVLRGIDAASEYFAFEMRVELNDLGRQMFDWIVFLEHVGLIELGLCEEQFISVAPWHGREI